MRKIPTLFVRDPVDRRFVTRLVQEGCEWVLAGEGVATRKYDGTCVLFDPQLNPTYDAVPAVLQGWWARREVKPGAPEPAYYQRTGVDEVTGKIMGWEPADMSSWARWLVEAVDRLTDGPHVGTHELLGPKINRDPERMGRHVVLAHQDATVVDAPRDYDGLANWLRAHPYEGLVWQHPDGRMAKLKRKDMKW